MDFVPPDPEMPILNHVEEPMRCEPPWMKVQERKPHPTASIESAISYLRVRLGAESLDEVLRQARTCKRVVDAWQGARADTRRRALRAARTLRPYVENDASARSVIDRLISEWGQITTRGRPLSKETLFARLMQELGPFGSRPGAREVAAAATAVGFKPKADKAKATDNWRKACKRGRVGKEGRDPGPAFDDEATSRFRTRLADAMEALDPAERDELIRVAAVRDLLRSIVGPPGPSRRAAASKRAKSDESGPPSRE